jgi:predicted MPP superfamily phosphohydrolase
MSELTACGIATNGSFAIVPIAYSIIEFYNQSSVPRATAGSRTCAVATERRYHGLTVGWAGRGIACLCSEGRNPTTQWGLCDLIRHVSWSNTSGWPLRRIACSRECLIDPPDFNPAEEVRTVSSDSVGITAQPARVILKLQFEQDYDAFVREGRIAPTLSAIAKILDIAPAEISLLAVRSGCTIMVISLPKEEAEKLKQYFDARQEEKGFVTDIEGLSKEQIEVLNSNSKAIRIMGASYFNSDSKLVNSDPRLVIEFKPDLSWMHISDLHIKEEYTDPGSDTRADLKRFLDNLPICLEDAGITPDAIFFTGDVAKSGSPTQYKVAESFFTQLTDSLPKASKKAPFLVIPGNHDVNWDEIDIDPETELRKQLSPEEGKDFSTEEFAKVITDHNTYISKRMANYVAFSKKFNGKDCNWFDVDAFSCCFTAGSGRLKIGVGGFNSAWLSTRRDLLKAKGIDDKLHGSLDLESLALGPRQIRHVKKSLDDSKVDLRVALVHHAPESVWYRGYDNEVQHKEFTDFDFVLRGHQHEPEARQRMKTAGKDGYVELAPGALRTRPERFQGFMAVELDFSAEFMRLTAWKPSSVYGTWVLDPDFGKGGVDFRPLPTPLLDRLKSKGHKVLT